LRDFGDEVCRAQQHDHPAGPTAMEILTVACAAAGPERLRRLGAPYLQYLRKDREVEDAREMALMLALWAGAQLAALMHYDGERINAYLDERNR
jgi:hypothetical protein